MKDATVIPLEFWQDPQSDVILVYSERECSVFFNCWTDSGVPADFIGQISFEYAAATRSFMREFLPYGIPAHRGHSYILEISDSPFVQEYIAYRQRHYADDRLKRPAPKHYVVVGHDIYHEILADGFSAIRIMKREISDPRLLRLIAFE